MITQEQRGCAIHMVIPTEPIGSIPRPLRLIEAFGEASGDDPKLDPLYEEAIEDTIFWLGFEATGSPVITDGEQRKYQNFWTYSVEGLPNTAPDGFAIPFAGGARTPHAAADWVALSVTKGVAVGVTSMWPCCYARMCRSSRQSSRPFSLKLNVSGRRDLLGYTREQFLQDLLDEHETEIPAILSGKRRAQGANRLHGRAPCV